MHAGPSGGRGVVLVSQPLSVRTQKESSARVASTLNFCVTSAECDMYMSEQYTMANSSFKLIYSLINTVISPCAWSKFLQFSYDGYHRHPSGTDDWAFLL